MYLKLYISAILALLCGTDPSVAQGDFELSILHLNDFHARFEETNVYSGRCTDGDKEKNRCYGGFARVNTIVSELRRTIPNTLFLSGGDYYQGTIWYSLLKWEAMAHFLNIVQHDAMAFGNHEFDNGIEGIVPLLEAVNFPILGANINDRKEPSIRGKYQKSVVLERAGRKIGIIGYLTTETLMISTPGRLDITDEVVAVREEAKKLKSQGVDIIIALGHAGYKKDITIAQEIEEVDVVVGGHTNTFLYTGEDPSTEMSVDQYPYIATQKSGKKVPVVQAYAFGKYLGKLDLTFNSNGDVTKWAGNPILLDNAIERDPFVLAELIPWRERVEEISKEEIGKTYVFLDGNRLSCRMRECNLGNLNADAIIQQNTKYPDDMRWGHTGLAVINGGGIRSSIDERASNGTITMDDILTFAPFRSTIDIVELRGVHVRQMFEHGVAEYDPKGLDPKGGFLQVSGFVVVYDINLPSGSRVVRLQARCIECRVPELLDVVDDEIYRVAMPAFLAEGGDGFTVIRDNKINHHLTGMLDTAVYSEYIRSASPIHQGLENRILFIDSTDLCPDEDASSPSGIRVAGDAASPSHNPNDIDPHEMMTEVMDRHDEYFEKHFASSSEGLASQEGSQTKSQGLFDGYVYQTPFQVVDPTSQEGSQTKPQGLFDGYVYQTPFQVDPTSQEGSQTKPQGLFEGYVYQTPFQVVQTPQEGSQTKPQGLFDGYVYQTPSQKDPISQENTQAESQGLFQGYIIQTPILNHQFDYFHKFGDRIF